MRTDSALAVPEVDTMSHENILATSIQRIRAAAEMMQRESRFKLRFEEYAKLDDEDLCEWEDWLRKNPGMEDYRVPSDLHTLYKASGGFIFQWQLLTAEHKIVAGSARIATILSLYQGDDEVEQPVSAIYDSPRPFDVISDTEYVSIIFSRNAKAELIHVDDEEKTRNSLILNPVEYVLNLSEYRAIYGWQSLFHVGKKRPSVHDQMLKDEIKKLFGS